MRCAVLEADRKQRFLKLQRAFLDEAAADVAELLSLLNGQSTGTDARRCCRVIAHNLRGTGASYGYAQISDTAACLDNALDAGASETDVRAFALRLREAVAICDGSLSLGKQPPC